MTKLSEIKYKDILFNSSAESITKIVYEEEKTKIKEKCDIGFIFGGVSMIPYRVDDGIELYNAKLVERLLVSGGVGFQSIDRINTEASKMRTYLLERGISKKDILVEDGSRNTVENIRNSFELLKKDYSEYEIPKIKYALITSDFHVRRCLGLFANQLYAFSSKECPKLGYTFSEIKESLLGNSVIDGKTDIVSWQDSIYGKRMIYQEAILLCMYAKQKRLEDLEIEDLEFKRKLK